MKVCLIGNGLTTLSLGKNLINKKIKVFNFTTGNKKKAKTRTIGISKDSLNFFNKEIIQLKKNMTWDIKKIDIYTEKYKDQKILNFEKTKKNLFSIFKNSEIEEYLEKNLKKNKLFKKVLIKNDQSLKKVINMNFDLIINCDANNIITEEFFFRKINKNYNSKAFTCIIEHKKIVNNTAAQIFTKIGPIAFLPLSNFKTSIVFSANLKNKKFNDKEILKLIKFYNYKYEIINFSKLEKFNLSFSVSRNYFYRNILAFGDVIHRVHPLAGQGFNITLRDIKVLSELIQKRLDLGLPLDNSIFEDFENRTKHLNYLFTSAVDLVYEFFKFDNKINNNISKGLFKFMDSNKNFNKFFTRQANKGLVL
jgi:2-octaprenyl-6-methoxyphenol hydroxylase